jgi:hypothetical protein
MLAIVEFADMSKLHLALFVVIFLLNLLPAFAPPTWMAMSFIGLTIPGIDFISFAVLAAAGATFGRIYLGKVVAGNRAAEVAEPTDTVQRRRHKTWHRRSAHNHIWYVLSLRLQPAPLKLSVHCLRPNVTPDRIPHLSFLYRTSSELCFLD